MGAQFDRAPAGKAPTVPVTDNELHQPSGTAAMFLALLLGRLFLLVFSRDRGVSSSVLLLCSIGLDLFFYSFFYFQGKETAGAC